MKSRNVVLVVGLVGIVGGVFVSIPKNQNQQSRNITRIEHSLSKPALTPVNSKKGGGIFQRGSTAESRSGVPTEFEPYFARAEKALRTEEEIREMRKDLADRRLIERSAEVLSAKTETTLELPHQVVRMKMVDFLSSAIDWKENPSRDLAIERAQGIASRDISKLELPTMLKRSLVGDQIELLEALDRANPGMVARILTSDGANHSLIAYVTQMHAMAKGQ